MSDIRRLLADAQSAESRGHRDEAVRLLLLAAAWYRDRQMLRRAAQMLRQARRVEGIDDEAGLAFGGALPDDEGEGLPMMPVPEDEGDDGTEFDESPFGFDDEPAAEPGPRRRRRTLVEQRTPQLADPAVDAWCSFCCRPKAEVGPLVAGPAGAFICAACGALAGELLQGGSGSAPRLAPPRHHAAPPGPSAHLLPAQRRAKDAFGRGQGRLALLLGPEGAGKSAWLEHHGTPVRPPLVRFEGPLALIDAAQPLSPDDEARLLEWLEGQPGRRAVVAVRAPLPKPALVLKGAQGDEPIYDTASLGESVNHVSPRVLSKVDSVLGLEPADEAALIELADALARARGVTLPRETLAQLVGLALKSGRGAHELASLVARIPPGTYA